MNGVNCTTGDNLAPSLSVWYVGKGVATTYATSDAVLRYVV